MRREQAGYLLAWMSGGLVVVLVLGYAFLGRIAPAGWFNDFLSDAAPGLAAVAATYLVAYLVLFRRGLGRDQQLVEEIVEGLTRRSAVAPEVIAFSARPGRLDWGQLLADAEELDVAGRWFSAWTNENYDALRDFFGRGGRLRAFMLAPENASAIERGAKQHAGYGDHSPTDPAHHKVVTGARRLREAAAAAGRPDALELLFITTADVVIAQTLFRFAGRRQELLVLYAHDNFRADRHRAPAFVLDLRSSEELREFWAKEIDGFMRHSRLAGADEPRDS